MLRSFPGKENMREFVEFVIAGWCKVKIAWLYNLKLEQEMRNLVCDDQWILLMVTWLVILSFQNILWPSPKNWEFGNESLILVSINKQIPISLGTRSLKLQNLFLIEMILRCPIVTFLGQFKHCLRKPFNALQGVSEDTDSIDFADSLFCLLE